MFERAALVHALPVSVSKAVFTTCYRYPKQHFRNEHCVVELERGYSSKERDRSKKEGGGMPQDAS